MLLAPKQHSLQVVIKLQANRCCIRGDLIAVKKAYLIARIRVHDKEGFETFKQMSTPLISEYGGRLLARNPEVETLEGNQEGLVVLIEFGSMDEARQFYFSDGYTAAKLVREKASEADLILVEGV